MPTRRTRSGCCPRAANGHAATPPIAPKRSRRLTDTSSQCGTVAAQLGIPEGPAVTSEKKLATRPSSGVGQKRKASPPADIVRCAAESRPSSVLDRRYGAALDAEGAREQVGDMALVQFGNQDREPLPLQARHHLVEAAGRAPARAPRTAHRATGVASPPSRRAPARPSSAGRRRV